MQKTETPIVEIPENVQDWVRGMIRGTQSLRVGHMMFATDENFRTQTFKEGLYLIRTGKPVKDWVTEEGADPVFRSSQVKSLVADTIRALVLDVYDKASYPGD